MSRPAANRLVVVSNRVALPRETRAGGLAAAMRAALKEHGGLWFGWSGKRVAPDERTLHRESAGNIDYALLDLTREEYETYYLGFANRTLWPLLHFQPTLMQYSRTQYAGYREVNKLFAEKLAPLLRDDDRIWIHDYHLIPLAAELRERGIGARIGFFLHIPLPPPELLINLRRDPIARRRGTRWPTHAHRAVPHQHRYRRGRAPVAIRDQQFHGAQAACQPQ